MFNIKHIGKVSLSRNPGNGLMTHPVHLEESAVRLVQQNEGVCMKGSSWAVTTPRQNRLPIPRHHIIF